MAGASDVLNEGYVTYSNEAKERLIHVSHETLETYGAVSEQTAHEMAEGAAKAANANAALSATGIAGPGGGTPAIPIGTIWIAYGSKDDIRTFKLQENFGRDINLAIATNKSMRLFLDFLQEKEIKSE